MALIAEIISSLNFTKLRTSESYVRPGLLEALQKKIQFSIVTKFGNTNIKYHHLEDKGISRPYYVK